MAPPDERSGMLLAGRRLVTPTAVYEPGWVHVSGSSVTDVGAGAPPRRPDFDLSWATLVPGFIDAHAHGGGGHAYTDHDVDAAAAAAALHLVHGTTTTLASLVTASTEDLVLSVRLLSPLVDDGILVGLHLEGPWLSPHHAGAHDPAQLRTPRPTEVQHLLDTAGGRVRMVTLAPELDGGLDAVRRVVGYGAVAAIGHTDATYATTRAALAAGATAGTHLFNAMRPIHHREPGPIPALLDDDRAYLELIADGVHLPPAILAGTIRRAGSARTLLVSDAMAAAGASDGRYRLGGLDVDVRDRQARLASTGAIAGSTLTMAAAVRHAVQVAGVPLVDAIQAATATPAALLGLSDLGEIRAGGAADVVALDDDLQVTAVLRRGDWVSGAPH